jgi:mannose/fructose/N-acetylgalactosamine-specific phosphotransferase system component IIC
MYKFKSFNAPAKIMAWLISSVVMLAIWDTVLSVFLIIFSDLTYQDITNSVPFWIMNFFMFAGFLTAVGTWLWED